MTRRHMKIFMTLYENDGNMTKSAELLYMAQPGISLALAELEEHYQVKLYERISRKLYITDVGKKFYHYAKGISDMFEDVELAMKQQGNDLCLKVGCCDSIDACLMPKYVSQYHQIHPGVVIRSYVDSTETLETQIEKNELDFAIVDTQIRNSKVVYKDFIADVVAFGADPSLGYGDGDVVTMEQLIRMPLLMRKRGSGARDVVERAISGKRYLLEPVLESTSAIYVLNAALSGMGVAMLPEKMLEPYHRRGRLNLLQVEDEDFKIMYGLIYHKDKKLSSISTDFIKMCQGQIFG